jgi:hypothetical protein
MMMQSLENNRKARAYKNRKSPKALAEISNTIEMADTS